MRFSEAFLLLLVLWGRGPCGRSLIYQRDVSEHCRRRALPSVFLGKRVVEANAQMMHFSRLELPYNCFIAIRAETGTHIILVVQLLPDEHLESSCKNDGNQMLIYEMGETFGGYWGQVPLDYVRRTTAKLPSDQTVTPTYHTLKTTRKTTMPTMEPPTTPETTTVEPVTGADKTKAPVQQVWTDVVPLLNLSLQLLPSDTEVRHRINSDDAFDAFYDVTPVSGVAYGTSIVPLMQFSMAGLKDERRDGSDGGGTPLFDLVYSSDDKFTPETRHKPHLFRNILHKHKTTSKMDYFRTIAQRYDSGRVLKITTERLQPTFAPSPSQSQQRSRIVSNKLINKFQYNQNQLNSHDISTEATARSDTTTQDSWLHVMDLMNILKYRSSTSDVKLYETNDKQLELLRKISQLEHNMSVYLEPDLDTYIKNQEKIMQSTAEPQLKNKTTANPMTLTKPSEIEAEDLPSTKQYFVTKGDNVGNSYPAFRNIFSANTTTTIESYVITTYHLNGTSNSLADLNVTSTIGHIFSQEEERTTLAGTKLQQSPIATVKASSNASTLAKLITGALVGHESWDNVVNVAPKMAMVLNKTNHSLTYNNSSKSKRRKRRDVQALDVNSGPHAWVQRLVTTVAPRLHSETDMYGFSPIVEPRDDEIYGRVHLRYVRRFIGPAIFNLCNYTHDEPKIRQVLLFNSSRILIGISNFTIKRMTLVATSARTLESVAARCPLHHLECQVSGARVCIDSSSACDGVPNCGAYDIYDEDRLTCGAGRGLQHNVYLAAFTFLAVLMTVCYSVHYWLKRCVPQVSEAFFVYTNGAENILYLDSIMKSPMDTDDLSKMFYQGAILEEGYLRESTDRRSTMRKLIDRISVFFQKKPDVTLDHQKRQSHYEPKKLYSFTELELNRFSFKATADTSTQIGESLEMGTYSQEQNPTQKQTVIKVKEHSLEVIEEREYASDLPEVTSMMEPKRDLQAIKLFKFLREARGSLESAGAARSATAAAGHEDFSGERSASDERELRNLLYDLPGSMKESFSSLTVAYDPGDIAARSRLQTAQSESVTPGTSNTKKCLRFEEAATVIPSANYETDDPLQPKQSLVPGAQDLEPTGEVSGMDFMRFWNIKPKKPKNKGHVSLREK